MFALQWYPMTVLVTCTECRQHGTLIDIEVESLMHLQLFWQCACFAAWQLWGYSDVF